MRLGDFSIGSNEGRKGFYRLFRQLFMLNEERKEGGSGRRNFVNALLESGSLELVRSVELEKLVDSFDNGKKCCGREGGEIGIIEGFCGKVHNGSILKRK